ncbi:hypothetical protein JFU48_20960 [Pseudomonas sp. TH49]|uniref:hypothetical protein n=1 Tax=Pseudomonas sp. TH49 TaxID=2796413 RepID=UPI001911F4B1|nr:hypothetical protein [Pseudomonas sp. TH49]MBK5343848.1 hypothetical protein [Pseudomonas sp. TH49]
MTASDDLRFKAHHRLLDLDATTNHLMMLVVASEVTGSRWDEAVARHRQAFDAWAAVLTGVQVDPLPPLDGRPAESGALLSE